MDRRRPDIQALRAIAVAMVVVFHAFPGKVPGGYVGVDVFFVISGYLITARLARDAERRELRLGAFYARRMRRILPAALFVLVATLVMVRVHLLPLQRVPISADAVASALFFPNIHFASEATDYLATGAPSPLLHYWSLGVEEQFYLVWPALIIIAFRLRWRPLTVLGVVVAVSFVASIIWTERSPVWAFYGLPSRAWEFGVGGLLALAGTRLERVPGAMSVGAGLLAIGAAGLLYDPETTFPGAAALLPVAGAALVIAGGARRPPRTTRLLSLWPLQRVGDVSYSLYLWHWPLLVLFVGETPTMLGKSLLCLLALALAAFTYRFVELPPQRAGWSDRRTFALAFAVVAVGVSISVASRATGDLDAGRPVQAGRGPDAPAPAFVPSNLTPRLADAREDFAPAFNGCVLTFGPETSGPCRYGDPRADRRIVVFGDSHAGQWVSAVQEVAARRGMAVEVLAKANCPPADVTVYLTSEKRYYDACTRWRERTLRRIAADPPALIVAGGSRKYGRPDTHPAVFRGQVAAGLERTLRRLRATAPVLLIADTPTFPVEPPVCLTEHLDDADLCAQPAGAVLDASYTAMERAVARAAGATVLDVNPTLCPEGVCAPIHGNLLVYADGNHLTETFTLALVPELARAAEAALSAPAPPG